MFNDEFVSFTMAEVPKFLRESEFFLGLEENDDEITLSRAFYKPNLYVKSLSEMRHLLSTMRFWGVKGIPRELVMYVANNPEADLQSTLSEFTKELKCVAFLEELGRKLQNIEPVPSDQYLRCTDGLQVFKGKSMTDRLIAVLSNQFKCKRGQIWNEFTCVVAVELGWLDCLTFLHENMCPWDKLTCEQAARYDQLGCLRYAHGNGCEWDAGTTQAALRSRSSGCFTYARDHGCPWDVQACAAAAYNQDLNMLKFAHENGCPWDETTCENAAYHNNLSCLKYAHEQGCPWNAWTCYIAALGGRIAVLIYAHENGCPWDKTTCETAARANHLACLGYAHETGCPWDVGTCIDAARKGSLACLEYAHTQGCPWNEEVVRAAASTGHLKCLKYALDNGCPGRERACCWATDNVECLMYLREELHCPWDVGVSNACALVNDNKLACLRYCIFNGCPVDETTTTAAAGSKTVDKLRLLHQSGCPWDERALWVAATNKSLECFEYLVQNNCPGRDEVAPHVACDLPLLQCAYKYGCVLAPEVAYRATLKGDRPLSCVKFLHQNGCTWPRDICTVFAQAKRADCLQYAHSHGAECEIKTIAAAVDLTDHLYSACASERSLECLQYLHDQGCPWDASTYYTAKQTSNDLCVRYLEKYKCPRMREISIVLTVAQVNEMLQVWNENGSTERSVVVQIDPALMTGAYILLRLYAMTEEQRNTMLNATDWKIVPQTCTAHTTPHDVRIAFKTPEEEERESDKYFDGSDPDQSDTDESSCEGTADDVSDDGDADDASEEKTRVVNKYELTEEQKQQIREAFELFESDDDNESTVLPEEVNLPCATASGSAQISESQNKTSEKATSAVVPVPEEPEEVPPTHHSESRQGFTRRVLSQLRGVYQGVRRLVSACVRRRETPLSMQVD